MVLWGLFGIYIDRKVNAMIAGYLDRPFAYLLRLPYIL